MPGQLVIQFTDHCNGSCPQCGMRKSNPFHRSLLDQKTGKRILEAAAARGAAAVSFTGGEPLLHMAELTELINYAGKVGIPYIRTGTNGFHFSGYQQPGFFRRIQRLARTLAATPLRNFWISIDSVEPAVHDRMRGFKDLMRGIQRALPIFHAAGIYPSANLGLNRNLGGSATSRLSAEDYSSLEEYAQAFYETYRMALTQFYQRVIDFGFTIVNTCYPMSVAAADESAKLKPVYAATAKDRVVQFSKLEKHILFKALLDTIVEFRAKIRIFTPLCALYNLIRQHSSAVPGAYPCRGGQDFFFIDAAGGNTYPCGYRGQENLGKFWRLPSKILPSTACQQCDWECFRDPSELMGPLLEDIRHPMQSLPRLYAQKAFFRYWVQDLAYYRACGFFDGRRPPVYGHLARFHASPDRMLNSQNCELVFE
jgi:MoaA/NifB/PqqE/SkfB family radical SAM enzyme